MPAGLLLAIALVADAPGAVPAGAAPVPKAAEAPAKAADGCTPGAPIGDAREIIVCAPRHQGYRIHPDVLEANRTKRGGRPKRPERLKDNSCASVGPFGCTPGGGGVDIVGGALVAATMVAKAIRGENVGKMFITDPQRSEYDHYVEAKRQREAEEAEAAAVAAAKAKVAKAKAGQATGAAQPAQ